MGFDKKGKFGEMDNGLLEEFEDELYEEEQNRKNRIRIVIGGLALGAFFGLYLVFFNDGPISIEEAIISESKRVAKTPLKVEPTAEPSPTPEDQALMAPEMLVSDEPITPRIVEKEPEPIIVPAPVEGAPRVEPDIEPAEENLDDDRFKSLDDIHKDNNMELSDSSKSKAEPAPARVDPPAPKIRETRANAHQPDRPLLVINEKRSARSTKPRTVVKEQGVDLFSVRVMASVDAVKALATRDKLKEMGYIPWISQGKVRQSLFRVVAGDFRSIKDASALSARLAKAGFRTRTSYLKHGSMVSLEVGVYRNRKLASNLKNKLKKAGFEAVVRDEGGSRDLYVVMVGKYDTFGEASRAEKKIAKTGQKTMGVAKAN